MDQTTFSSEIDVPAPKGMTASFRVATRNSQLQCIVLTFPTSSFTSYAGAPFATWWTTTYSVSLHRSLTFHHFPPRHLVLIAWYLWLNHNNVSASQPHNWSGGEPLCKLPRSISKPPSHMLAYDGSAHKHSPSGNNNQWGGEDASQTSGSGANNRSLPTRCCCRPAGAPASVAPTEPSYRAIACQSCEIVSDGNAPPARCTRHGKLWSCTSGYQRRSIALLPGWT